jgi:hypothetical protein
MWRICKDLEVIGDGPSGVPRNFVREGGVQQIQLRTECRERTGM